MSVIMMAEISRISKTTIMKVLDYFVTAGVVSMVGKGDSTSGGGKRPGIYQLNDSFIYEIGVHVSPGEVLAVIINAHGNTVTTHCITLKEDEARDSVIAKISSLCKKIIKKAGIQQNRIAGIAIAFPGIVDSEVGIVRYLPRFPSWGEDINIVQMLRKAGMPYKISIDNESRFLVTAEMIFGVAAGCRNIISVFADNGLVAGIVIDGQIRRGTHHLEGEIGHMIVNPDSDELCVCGGRGCLEVMLMQSRLLARVNQGSSKNSNSLIFKNNSQPTIKDVFTAAEAGDIFARSLLDEVIKWLAICFSNLIVMHDPEIIVLQGVYANAGDYFLETLIRRANTLVLPRINKQVKIVYSALGHDATARGAACHILEEYFNGEI